MGGLNNLFNMSPDQASNLQNFGFGMMASGGTPGATLAGSIGRGGLAMNEAAQQRAQTQNINAEAQGKQIQNQIQTMMLPFQMQMAQYRQKALQDDMSDPNAPQSLNAPSGATTGQPWQPTAGTNNPSQKPTRTQPVNPSAESVDASPMAINPAVYTTAQNVGVSPNLLHGIFMTESSGSFNPSAGDGGQAIGAMQLHPAAAQDAGGGDRADPLQNLKMGATYLKQNMDKYGDPAVATLAYNWGPGNTDKWLQSGGDPQQIPAPQMAYLQKVNQYATTATVPGQSAPDGRNAGQAITGNPSAQLPQTSADIETLQGRITAMTQKINRNQLLGMPTTALETNLKAANEQLNAAQKIQEDTEAKGPGAQSQKNAENLADAQKTFNVAAGNLPRALQRFQQLRVASADASSGLGIDQEGNGLYPELAQSNFGSTKTATANQIIQQASKQGILSELGPQLEGLKGNKFLEGIASGASGLNPKDKPETKINAINGLESQYVGNMRGLASQRHSYGDSTAPTDADIDSMIAKQKNIPIEAVQHLQANPKLASQFQKKYNTPSDIFLGQSNVQ